MSTFRKSAFITTIATYLLIFMGGLVRVSGAGLGCPDWPKCFGRWIPPLSAGQLPPHIDPARFNFALAWTEYINRLVGVTVGILVLATAYFAIRHMRRAPRILYGTIAAALLIGYQGWQGGQVVLSELEPLIVSVHMGLALVIVSLLIYITQEAYYLEFPQAESGSRYPGGAKKWIAGLWAVSILQIVLGTRIREAIEILARDFPMLSKQALLDKAGAVQHVHWILGILMFLVTWRVGARIINAGKSPSGTVRACTWSAIGLIVLQLFVGIILISAGLPAAVQLAHLWIASIYIGALLVLFNAIRKSEKGVSDVHA